MASARLLGDALRIKLVLDSYRRLDPADWLSVTWTRVPLGEFYASESLVKDAVLEATRIVVKLKRKRMSSQVERRLTNGINRQTTPVVAVRRMKTASDSATRPVA